MLLRVSELRQNVFEGGNDFVPIDVALLELQAEVERLCGRSVLEDECLRTSDLRGPGLYGVARLRAGRSAGTFLRQLLDERLSRAGVLLLQLSQDCALLIGVQGPRRG